MLHLCCKMHFLFFVTDLKNEFLFWLIKMPRVLRCGRLERPYRMAFLMGSQSGVCEFRTLWMVESLVGTCFVELDAVVLFFYSFIWFISPSWGLSCVCLSSLTNLLFQLNFHFTVVYLIFTRIFPLSCSCLVSPAPLWNPRSTACTLPPVTSLQAFSHCIHYYLDGDVQERPTFALSSLLRQPLCRVT